MFVRFEQCPFRPEGSPLKSSPYDKFIPVRMPRALITRVCDNYHNSPFRWPWVLVALLALLLSSFASLQAATITLAWDANSDTSVAGYRVHYGTSSGNYVQTLDVGNTTAAVLPNLNDGITYFFAVTAYNSVALESPLSDELSFTPPIVPRKVAVSSIARTNGGNVQLNLTASGSSVPGNVVHVYYSNDLTTWTWLNDVTLNTGTVVVTDPTGGAVRQRFYRLAYDTQ